MTGAIVWSKDGCGACVQTKSLLESKNIPYEERNITSGDWTVDQLLAVVPNAKTLPQIFLNDEYVGGFNNLKAILE